MEDAIFNLVAAINKQIEKQEEANNLMRALIETLQETGQAVANLDEHLAKRITR